MKYITLLLLFAFFSCTYPCAPSDGLRIQLVGSNVTRYRISNDTLLITASTSTARLLSKYDYLIRIPSTNSVFYITEMNEPQQEGRKSRYKVMCVNAIQSCKINGAATPIRSDHLYLKK